MLNPKSESDFRPLGLLVQSARSYMDARGAQPWHAESDQQRYLCVGRSFGMLRWLARRRVEQNTTHLFRLSQDCLIVKPVAGDHLNVVTWASTDIKSCGAHAEWAGRM
jgi:hypothetical protein